MSAAADLVLTNAEIHTLTDPDETYEAVAIRDGEIVRLGTDYDVTFLAGVETEEIDLDGHVLLPGFIDAHTHLEMVGRRLVHADLSEADSPEGCLSLLDDAVNPDREWILGYGYDESSWAESRLLTREDLDRVSEDRPVVAFREDLHTAGVNSVALDRFHEEMPDADVRTESGEPTGVLVEEALDPLFEATEPGREELQDLLGAATERATELGITSVHEMVRGSQAPRVYRDLAREGALPIRVRLNYWSDHLDGLTEIGLGTNHGGEFVRTGAIKTYTDGSFGARTAKLAEPYADGDTEGDDGVTTDAAEDTGQWVVAPEDLHDLVRRADGEGFQMTAHAIGDRAIEATLEAYEAKADDPESARHRIEHAELLNEDLIERFRRTGAVASVQPNFLRWAEEGGLYDQRLGERRRKRTNRYADLLGSDIPLAFGSDCMPLGPLYGIHRVVNAPTEGQRLPVTEALRAYTHGAAYAGFDEDRLGTIETGKQADLVALDRSPWDYSEDIEDVDVSLTVVDSRIVYNSR
ncbi:amidohydrolase [Halobacteriales archaeon QS_3_64_16]|nr:MAG: amidohydrolase [Halobacteriales archaeon QS_3_64_16]